MPTTRKRGRKSAAELEIAGLATVTATARPDAPYDLTDEEAEIWRGIVASLPADWFTPGSHPVLAQLCRSVIAARRVAQLIRQAAHGGGEYDCEHHLKLLQHQDRISATIRALSTTLRLTPQSRYAPHTAARQAAKGGGGPLPWEF